MDVFKKLTINEAVKQRPGMYFGAVCDRLRNLLLHAIEACLNPGAHIELALLSEDQFVITGHTPLPKHEDTLRFNMQTMIAACDFFIYRNDQGFRYFFMGNACTEEALKCRFSFPISSDTQLVFKVNPQVIPELNTLNLLELAEYCKPKIQIIPACRLTIRHPDLTLTIHYPQGLKDRLAEISAFRTAYTPIDYSDYQDTNGHCAVALRFAHTGPDHIELVVNGDRCIDGGTAVKQLQKILKTQWNNETLTILAVIQLTLNMPQFYGSVKEKLADPRGALLISHCISQLINDKAAVQNNTGKSS